MQFNKIKNSVFGLIILSFLSCDRDLNDLGSEVIGENHFGMKKINLDIKAFNQKIENPNTTNLAINPLGIYKNAMGKTTAHFVSQVELSSIVSNIVTPGTVVVENVYLEVPYTSSQTSESTTDIPKYKISNIYPKDTVTHTSNKFRLNVFENGYDLRVTSTEGQEIYMNEKAKFLPNLKGTDAAGNSVLGGTRLNDDANQAENEAFFFDNKFITDTDYTSTETTAPTSKVAPKMKIKLNKNYFKKKIFENTAVLANQELFKNHFKGLYFQVEEIPGNQSMAMLDFSNAKIIIQYKDEVTTGNFTKKQYIINVRGITASLQDFQPNITPIYGTEEPNLFLKGGAGGNMIVVGLNNSDNILDSDLKNLKYLKQYKDKIVINDAYIEYYIDKNFYNETLTSEIEKKDALILNNSSRTVVYNLPNETTTFDFQLDNTTNSGNRLFDKSIFGGFLFKLNQESFNNNEYFYRVKVTQQLINLIKSDQAINVSLGIVPSNDINAFGTGSFIFKSKLKSEIGSLPTRFENPNPTQEIFNSLNMEQSPSGLRKIKNIPTSSITLPVGSKIYGTNSSDAKKMKLVVYYTEKN